MKCPNCNGVPYDEVWTCEVCNGKGIVEPLTEQEYMQTCNTEQLAEFIVNLTLLDVYKLYDRMESAEYDIGIGVGAKKVIAEWLKQPHTPKE